MKKILVTRKLLKSNEEKLKKFFDVKLNSNDELYSQEKLIKMSEGCDGILSALTDKLDEKTIKSLPDSVKILSNFEYTKTYFPREYVPAPSIIETVIEINGW